MASIRNRKIRVLAITGHNVRYAAQAIHNIYEKDSPPEAREIPGRDPKCPGSSRGRKTQLLLTNVVLNQCCFEQG